ncbi:hypothetical protein BD410DRAFT_149052 [Rickenella mellea]|uniref:Spt20-like SEP domain-containing protein n=1 Tax=Rickenella mellea TaxID=50990 RepID=A0A4Y7QA58_9AGAM|nr:hypothetical protein BD410DRAFT_149052 [Rickenella mellea]
MRGTGYNVMRDDKEFLDENSSSPPSFSIYLYPEHWTLNNGPKFLYTHQVSSLLDDIRAYRIPTDFIELFHTAKVPYYNGCLIVELLDYRPVRAKEPILEKPDIQRVLLHPNPETIWADVCALNQRCGSKWMDMDALEVEARILMATAPPLCLDPDAHLTRMVNNVVRATTPNTPHSLKRKALLADPEEDETDKAKRIKIMQFMNPQANKPTFVPSYRILALKERRAALQNGQTLSNGAHPSVPPVPGPASSAIPAPLPQAVPHQNGNYDDPSKRNVTSNPPTHPPTPVSANSQQHNPHRSDSPQQPPSATMPPPQIPQQSYQQHVSVDPSKRMSPAKSKTSLPGPSPIISHAQPQQPASSAAAQSQGQPQRSQTPGFQPPIPSANFLNQPPAGKKKQPPPQKPRTPATQTQPLPQQPPPQPQPPMTADSSPDARATAAARPAARSKSERQTYTRSKYVTESCRDDEKSDDLQPASWWARKSCHTWFRSAANAADGSFKSAGARSAA